jgi:tetratricopeptide (TPR) repeat protein
MIRHELGDFDGAERAFEAAEDLATESSPVPIAWLYAQRARHLLAFGRVDEALAFVRDSVRRVPFEADSLATYADALRASGNEDEALSIYEEAIKHTTDPRVWGELSRMVRARGNEQHADTLKWRAMWRYGEMLARHPEAAYASAASFYLDTAGDAARALELYRKDLALGASSDRIVAVATALLATGRAPAACETIEKALAMPLKSAKLYWTAARAYALTGDAAKARDFAARARALNAKIEKLEPPMVAENAVAPQR